MALQIKSFPPHCRIEAVQEATGLPRSTIYELIATRGFPKPKKIGARSVWVTAEVLDWMSKNLTEANQ